MGCELILAFLPVAAPRFVTAGGRLAAPESGKFSRKSSVSRAN
jgi:hypothetical protein